MLAPPTVAARLAAIAAIALSAVVVAGCVGNPAGGEISATLTYRVEPFNATTPYKVAFPIPMLGGGPLALVALLGLTQGNANWTTEEAGGEPALVIVGVGGVALSARVTGADAASIPSRGLNWTHSHPEDRSGSGNGDGSRDAFATADLPLVVSVSASLDSGSNS